MKTKTYLSVLLMMAIMLFLSCSKGGGDGAASGNKIYYVIKATFDNPQDHGGIKNTEVTNVALTMPSGSNSVSGNLSTPHTTLERVYPSGMVVKATCQSVLTHVTVTVEIWRNGVLWKNQTVQGSNGYTDVTVTGTL
jgi:hypothetical protein